MDIANLIIRVTNEGLSAAQRELRRLGDGANQAASNAEKLSKSLSDISKYAAIGLAGMTAGIGLSLKKAMSFETAMAEVNKTVDFAAKDGLANLKRELLDLNKVIPLPFEELAAITASGGQLGVAERDLRDFTETVAKMAIAFDMSAADAGDAMAKLANVFEIPIKEIDRLGDAINTLSNNSPAKASEIVNALSRVGGLAKAYGLTADAGAALVSTFIAMGKPAEVAASAVNSMLITFSTLDMATKSQLIGFEKLGLNIDDFAQRVKEDGKAAIYEFLEAVNKLPKEDQIGVIAPIIGRDFGDDVALLAGNMGLLRDQMALVGETADSTKDYYGSMEAEFTKMAATTENSLTLFKNMIDMLVESVGQAFLPTINQMLVEMSPIIDKINEWAAANPELIRQIALVSASLLGSIVGLKLFADGVLAVKTTIEGLQTAFGAAKAAILALGSPIGLTIIALGILILTAALVYQNWDRIKKNIDENKAAFAALAVSVAAITVAVIAYNAASITAVASTIATKVALVATTVAAAAQSVAMGIASAATVIWTTVSTVAAAATTALGVAFAFLTSPIGLIVVAIGLLVAAGIYLYKNWDTVKAKAIEVWGAISKWVSDKAQLAKTALSNAWNAAKTATVNAFNGIKTSIITTLQNLPSQLLTIGKNIIQGLINGIKSGASGVTTAISNVASSAITAAKQRLDIHSPSRVMDKIGQHTTDGLAQGIKKGRKNVKSEAQKMADDAIKATQDAIATMQRDLNLFGNTSRVAEYQYDINTGKYGGNTSLLLELARQVDAQKEEAAVVADVLAMKREVYNLTTPYVTELSKVTYELEAIEGKYRNVNDQQKEWLLNAAQELDAYRAANTVRASMLDLDRQMSLLGNDSMFSALAYDLMDANNQLSELSDTMKDEWLTKVAAFEDAKKVTDITKDIEKSLESINREIALMDDSSGLAAFAYELNNTDKYAKAYAEDLNELGAAIERLDLLKAQKSSQTAFDSLLSDLRGGTEIDKLNEQYRDKLIVIEQFEAAHTDLLGEALEARYQLTDEYNRATGLLMQKSGESIFGNLASIMKDAVGEQSKAYRAMFAIEKGFAIAQSAIAIQQAVAKAMAVGFPANIPLIAQAIGQGASIMSALRSVRAPVGQAHDGIMSVPKSGTWNLEKGERVLPQHTAKAMDKKLAEGGGNTNVIIHNYTGAPIEQRKNENGDLEVMIGRQIQKQLPQEINNPYSGTNDALKRQYHMQRKLN